MSKNSKIIIAAASLLLVVLYFFPMWIIDLDAPQYPEGIGLHIWINKISGQKPNDLNTINGLNHYIGMKIITPEDIPELKLMPYIVAFLIFTGLMVSLAGKRFLLNVWVIIFFLVLAAGLFDFYMWEYDYGHNLDPHAAIKVPGMTYQPPLIGTKQLLNMKTTSLPHIGAIVAGISFMLGVFIMTVEARHSRKNKEPEHVEQE
ncbi:hypothetical protein F9K33_09975 [bacterium]|nr:MAG: hypothetical protein F9K33_09975 [bacterium]